MLIIKMLTSQRYVAMTVTILLKTVLFIYWLCWVFVVAQAFSSRGERRLLSSCSAQASQCGGFSCCWAQSPRGTGFGSHGSQVLEHRLNSRDTQLCCSMACGIFPDQGSSPGLPHLQVNSLPLNHQGNPVAILFKLQFLLVASVT